jgi:thiol-disulfide isomerase/thioredoxin
MKKCFINFIIPGILILITNSCSHKETANRFSFLPANPVAGSEITVRFNADSTGLAQADSINMIASLYSVDADNTVDVKMQKDGNYWSGRIKTADSTRGVIIKFVDASTEAEDNEIACNNDDKGFVIHLYDKKGVMVPGSLAGLANAIWDWGSNYLNLSLDVKLAEVYFKKDFSKNPGVKNDYLDSYLSLEAYMHNDQRDSIIKAELSPVEAKKNKSEKDLTLLVKWFDFIKSPEKSNLYKTMLSKEYPKSDYIQMQEYQTINNLKNINSQLARLHKFQKEFPSSDYKRPLYYSILLKYFKQKGYKNAITLILNNSENLFPHLYYYVANSMLQENTQLEDALIIAKAGVNKARDEIKNPKSKKSPYETSMLRMNNDKRQLALNLYVEAMILDKLQRDQEAEPLIEEAVNEFWEKSSEINEFYVKVLLKNSEYDKVLDKAGAFIKSGYSTGIMEKLFKQAYIKKNGSDEGLEKLLKANDNAASAKLSESIKSQMINLPAPVFTLMDLDGNKINLNELKGKTVVIDFWATWCGPCVASFPGMAKVLDNYSNDHNVKFFFVDTYESVKDKKRYAADFIKKNNYKFEVLLDTAHIVADKYQVSGIPAKFFIDKNGKIRYKSTGFSGNTDQMVKEVSAVITILNKI